MEIMGGRNMETGYFNRGGWFRDQPSSTGAPSASWLGSMQKYIVAGCCLLATGAGTGASAHSIDINRLHPQRSTGSNISSPAKNHSVEVTSARTPAEDLERIRKGLSPAMSDLAKSLNVSRQTIYNWLNGEPPTPEHAARLKDLALAADMFTEAGVVANGALLKRKVFQGKTLFESVREGSSARDSVQLLLQIVQREINQRERLATRFAGRTASQYFAVSDMMAANEEV